MLQQYFWEQTDGHLDVDLHLIANYVYLPEMDKQTKNCMELATK